MRCRYQRYFTGLKQKNRQEILPSGKQESLEVPLSSYTLCEHLSRCIGRTVTVFVTCGGPSSLGFTGVPLSVNNTYLRIVIQAGPAPAGLPCSQYFYPSYETGAIANIPLNRIAAFSHNSLSPSFLPW